MANQELNVPTKQETREEVTRAGRTYVPQVDIYETQEGLWLWADMPGVDESSINVHLDNGVLTIEGLDAGGTLHPLQDAFVRHGVPQCGFCIPGVLMAAAALLAETPRPSEDEIRYGIAGNLCRCTGYTKMITAISEAAPAVAQGASR